MITQKGSIMNDYIEGLSKEELKQLCLEFAKIATELGYDGDVVYKEMEEFDVDDYNPAGFYCVHSGEPLLDY